MAAHASKQISNLLMLLIGLSVWLFIFYKSASSSFTHDESFTYLNYPQQSFMKILSFSDSYSNNHILNSLMMKYSEKLFGDSEIALRLPNLLMFAMYLIYSFLILKNLNRWLAVPLFVILCTNVFLVDLFGMARGYGLSMGFMMVALYHFLKYMASRQRADLWVFHAAALLASLASFTLLTFYAAMITIFLLIRITEAYRDNSNWRISRREIIAFTVPLLISTAILYEPVRRVIKFNKLDFGGSTGFYPDTVKHLVINSLDGFMPPPLILLLLQILLTAIVGFSLFVTIRTLMRPKAGKSPKSRGLTVSTFLLVILSLIFIAQHHILGTSFPVARFSVFLFPLFVIQVGFLSGYFVQHGYRKATITVIAAMAMLSVLGFITRMELHAFGEWRYDQNTKQMLKVLAHEKPTETETISLGVEWLFEPTVNFYRKTQDLEWLRYVDREGLSADDNYFYISTPVPDSLKSGTYQIIAQFESSNTLLLKNLRK